MHLKDLLRLLVRIGYCIPVPDFYPVLHGICCRKSSVIYNVNWVNAELWKWTNQPINHWISMEIININKSHVSHLFKLSVLHIIILDIYINHLYSIIKAWHYDILSLSGTIYEHACMLHVVTVSVTLSLTDIVTVTLTGHSIDFVVTSRII